MRFRPTIPALFVMSLALGLSTATVRADPEQQGIALSRALDAASAGDWDEAATLVGKIDDSVAVDILHWTRLRHGAGDWSEYQDFLTEHGDWPGLQTMMRAGERRMPKDLDPEEVIGLFATVPPQTGTGSLRLAAALAATDQQDRAVAEITRSWRDLELTPAEQNSIEELWPDVVAEHSIERLDTLLWRGMTSQAQAMLSLVDEDWRALAKARIMTRRDAAGLMAQINAVPKSLRDHPGLAYERYLYRTSKGRWEEAEAYLQERSVSAEALGVPEMWMERRANLARQALRRDEVEAAYQIAAQSFGTDGADYADAEWLAGFIALTRMHDPERAIGHFERFGNVVATPISLGRAGYWLGRAYAAAGNKDAAAAAFEAGAEHQTSFYGQLAADRAGLDADHSIAGGLDVPDWHSADFMDWPVIKAARLLHYAGHDGRVSQFLRHAAEGQPAEIRAAIAQMAIDMGRPHIGIRIAKDAASERMILPDQYFPIHAIAAESWPVPPEFAMAIARQESELNAAAESPVGARGLMQLMPGTAEHVASTLGVAYNPRKLTEDSFYNARLGTAYLASLMERYDGSYILAAAAYNAGPGRANDWIEAFGDPRKLAVDPVVWIEMIPFSETRNYVMRVLEGLTVYRARLEGHAGPMRFAADKEAGRRIPAGPRVTASAM